MDRETTGPIAVGELTIRFLIEGGDLGGSVAVFECDVPANWTSPPWAR